MADIADVELTLVAAATAALYPNGSNAVSAVGTPLRIHRGKVSNTDLRFDRINGIADVAAFTTASVGRNTTRWGVQVTEMPSVPSLSVATSYNSATFLGTAAFGDIAGILINQVAHIYQTTVGDAASLVCAALAASIRAEMICWSTGATLTEPGVSSIVARCAHQVNATVEWGRQEKTFCIAISAQTPTLRDLIGGLLASAFAQISFLTLPDGTGGRLRYHGASDHDNEQGASVYCRDLCYDIEYPTTTISSSPTMLFGDLSWNGTIIFA